MYGKKADEIQEGIEVGEDSISGNLKYLLDFSEFSSVLTEQEGNFLALKISSNEGAVITTEIVNGTHGPVIVGDGICVYRITDKDTQSIKITTAKNDESETVIYSLTDLTCDISPEILLDSINDPVLDNKDDPIKGENSK